MGNCSFGSARNGVLRANVKEPVVSVASPEENSCNMITPADGFAVTPEPQLSEQYNHTRVSPSQSLQVLQSVPMTGEGESGGITDRMDKGEDISSVMNERKPNSAHSGCENVAESVPASGELFESSWLRNDSTSTVTESEPTDEQVDLCKTPEEVKSKIDGLKITDEVIYQNISKEVTEICFKKEALKQEASFDSFNDDEEREPLTTRLGTESVSSFLRKTTDVCVSVNESREPEKNTPKKTKNNPIIVEEKIIDPKAEEHAEQKRILYGEDQDLDITEVAGAVLTTVLQGCAACHIDPETELNLDPYELSRPTEDPTGYLEECVNSRLTTDHYLDQGVSSKKANTYDYYAGIHRLDYERDYYDERENYPPNCMMTSYGMKKPSSQYHNHNHNHNHVSPTCYHENMMKISNMNMPYLESSSSSYYNNNEYCYNDQPPNKITCLVSQHEVSPNYHNDNSHNNNRTSSSIYNRMAHNANAINPMPDRRIISHHRRIENNNPMYYTEGYSYGYSNHSLKKHTIPPHTTEEEEEEEEELSGQQSSPYSGGHNNIQAFQTVQSPANAYACQRSIALEQPGTRLASLNEASAIPQYMHASYGEQHQQQQHQQQQQQQQQQTVVWRPMRKAEISLLPQEHNNSNLNNSEELLSSSHQQRRLFWGERDIITNERESGSGTYARRSQEPQTLTQAR